MVNWVYGPAKADLGEAAQIDIPSGFKFAKATEAASILRAAGNPTPATVTGLVAPVNGSYMVVFEYAPIGYVKTSSGDKVDSGAALEALRQGIARQNMASPTFSMDWEAEPTYDHARQTVEWAIAVSAGNRRSVNHVMRLLGREGVLDGIVISPGLNSIPLKQLMAGVSFKSGFAYADFRKGDRVARHGLADLIATQEPTVGPQKTSYTWAYVGGGAGLLTVGGFVLMVRRRSNSKIPARRLSALATAVQVNGHALKQALQTNGHYHGSHDGHANGHETNGKLRKRRIFDYQRFYSDLMFEVSDRAQVSTDVPQRKTATAIATTSIKPVVHGEMSALTNAGLIEHQRRLIEEQQRLIREQAKLIEEKSRLIQEKNQVLDKQAELFGNNIF